jgi:hypothetical protein
MPVISIDDEVFAHIDKNARGLGATPNSTLRRLLGMAESKPLAKNIGGGAAPDLYELMADAMASAGTRTKARKAQLQVLIDKGYLKDGQELHLLDYKGRRIQNMTAVIAGSDLIHDGQRYSMSNLAKKLLKLNGFNSESVRGPAHWVDTDGKTVKELWQLCVDQEPKK